MADHHEVDVSNLVFGKEVDKESPPVPVLFNAEVALLLNKQKKNYQEKGIRVPETLTLTLEYCKRFANVKGLEDEGASQYLTNLRQVLEQWDFSTSGDAAHKKSLHPFEVAAIANLMTTSSDRDEACALIPSLRRTDKLGERFSDEQIDAILDSVQNFLLGLGTEGAGGDGGMGEDGMGEEEGSAVGMTGGAAGGADAMEEDVGGGGGGGYGEEEEDEF